MKKNIKYILSFMVFIFCFVCNVNAECSYQERKNMLDVAKGVEAYFEPDLNNKYFTFNLYNLDESIYVVINNSKTGENKEIHNYDMINNHYSFVENNIDDVITYYVNINSNNSSCYGNKITTKIVVKKIVNKFYYEDICKGIEDYTYCKPLLNNKFAISDSKIRENIAKYRDSLNVKEDEDIINKFGMDDLINLLKKYWYIFVIIIIISITIVVIIKINKKRGELI